MILFFAALVMGAAWLGHTDRSRRDAELIRAACERLDWKLSYVATELLGIGEKPFVRQLAGQDPLNHWRLMNLPDEFHQEYDALKAGDRDAVVLEASHVRLVHGFAEMSKPHMLKLTRPVVLLKERA